MNDERIGRLGDYRRLRIVHCALFIVHTETVPLKLMPGERLELSWPCDRQLLKLVRLPFRHPGISLYGMRCIFEVQPLPAEVSPQVPRFLLGNVIKSPRNFSDDFKIEEN
jgi:hypothetical protein